MTEGVTKVLGWEDEELLFDTAAHAESVFRVLLGARVRYGDELVRGPKTYYIAPTNTGQFQLVVDIANKEDADAPES